MSQIEVNESRAITDGQIERHGVEPHDQPRLASSAYPKLRRIARSRLRFGRDALRFANSVAGSELHLRGVNARVVVPGTVHVGDVATKVAAATPLSASSSA